MNPLALLNQPKSKYVDLSLSDINTADCHTVADCVKKIVEHAQNNKGVIAPLGSLISQTARDGETAEIMKEKRDVFWKLAGWTDDANENKIKSTLEQILAQNNTEIEARKDKLDFAPAIGFVEDNQALYQTGLDALLTKDPTEVGKKFAETVGFIGTKGRIEPQIDLDTARALLAHMPSALQQLSCLRYVDFQKVKYASGDGYPIIPVPGFDANGNLDFSKIVEIKPSDFPRKRHQTYESYQRGYILREKAQEDDHPTRILVGLTIGDTIYPTPIPRTLSQNDRAIELYQICVFMHEFFHTVEEGSRSYRKNNRDSIRLDTDGETFTLADWWKEWENLILSAEEPGFVSYYASTYSDKLTQEKRDQGGWEFEYAIAEQIAESFVAYMLDIQANPDGWTDFKTAAPKKWELMDKLCRATVISDGKNPTSPTHA